MLGSGSADLLLLLADRLAGAVHGLKITAVLDLLNGIIGVDSFGLEEQAFLDFKDRLAVGNATAVQREVEGPSGAQLLARLSKREQRTAQSLTVVARLLNDPEIVAYTERLLAAEDRAGGGRGGGKSGSGGGASRSSNVEPKRRAMAQGLMAVLKKHQPGLDGLLTPRQLRTVRADVDRLATEFYLDRTQQGAVRTRSKRKR